MPKERTGALEERKDAKGKRYYRARIRLADAARARALGVPQKYSYSRERAAEVGALAPRAGGREVEGLIAKKQRRPPRRSPKARARPIGSIATSKWRKARAFVTAADSEARLRRATRSRHFVGKRMADVTRDDIEAIVATLDRAIEARGCVPMRWASPSRRRGSAWHGVEERREHLGRRHARL